MYLLVEYQEGFTSPVREGHLTCAAMEDDYYNPVILLNTEAQLVEWLENEYPSAKITVNNGTVYVEKLNWKGDSKGLETYYMLEVQLGKPIVY